MFKKVSEIMQKCPKVSKTIQKHGIKLNISTPDKLQLKAIKERSFENGEHVLNLIH